MSLWPGRSVMIRPICLLRSFTWSTVSPSPPPSFLSHLLYPFIFFFCGLPTFSFPNLFWFLFSFLHSSYFSYIHASVNMTWYNLHNISQNKRATIPIRDSPVTNYGLGNISSILRLWPFTPHFLILSMDWWDKYHCSIDTFKEGQISLIIRPIIYLKALRLVQPATPLPKKQETEKNLYWCLHL